MAGDLQHQDWSLYSTKQILKTIDPDITVEIIGNMLTVSNVSEETIDKLLFLTNTDQNNNYFGFIKMNIRLNGGSEPTVITGFNDVVKTMFERSDVTAYLQGKKLHEPFDVQNLPNAPGFKGTTFHEYVDSYSSLIASSTNTQGKTKVFEVMFGVGPTR